MIFFCLLRDNLIVVQGQVDLENNVLIEKMLHLIAIMAYKGEEEEKKSFCYSVRFLMDDEASQFSSFSSKKSSLIYIYSLLFFSLSYFFLFYILIK